MTARNLGTIDRDICQPLGRLIQEAFADGIIGDINLSGNLILGGVITGGQGEVYFVEGNTGNNDNSGKDWNNAFKTLTHALAVSHANIAASPKGWAARNTIFCKGDYLDEDLTTLAQKTNIVGVGSCDHARCRLVGTHIIPATINYMGCRFYNFDFRDDGPTANFTITSQIGIEFHNCLFSSIANCTYGLYFVTCNKIKIMNCQFLPVMGGAGEMFLTAAIGITGTTVNGVQIIDNIIYGVKGIYCSSTTVYEGIIKDNLIKATGITIDDDSVDFVIVGNRLISAAAQSDLPSVLAYNAALAVDNILTGSSATIHCPAETA